MTASNGSPGGPRGLLALLWQVMQAVLDESAPALEELGLTPKTFYLLAAVEEHPFPAELSRAMHLPPPTVTYMIKQVESLGFLARRPEPGDLRRFRLEVTDAGREAICRGHAAIGSCLQPRMARLDPADLEHFERVVGMLSRPGEA